MTNDKWHREKSFTSKYSNREIARKTNHDSCVNNNYLRDRENYVKNQKEGVKTITTDQERRLILREVPNSFQTARRIVEANCKGITFFMNEIKEKTYIIMSQSINQIRIWMNWIAKNVVIGSFYRRDTFYLDEPGGFA